MSIYDLNAYEVIREEDLSDLKSKGILLKHKKARQRSYCLPMMTRIRYLRSDSAHRLRTVPEFLILWNIPCCVARKIFR